MEADGGFCQDCRDFACRTTAHGFGRAEKSSGVRRWIWVVLVLLMIAVVIGHVGQLVHKYMQYEMKTVLSNFYVSNVEFPAVTVCDRYDDDGVPALGADQLVGCSFGGKSCSNKSTKEVFVKSGRCVSFNDPTPLMQRQAGPSGGLRLSIRLHNDQSGLLFQVHSVREPPRMDSKGHWIDGGLHARVPISLTRYHALPAPYGACSEGIVNYTQAGCILECKAKQIVEKCACIMQTSEDSSTDDSSRKPPYCSSQNDRHCMMSVYNTLEVDDKVCDCPIACRHDKYDVTLSYSGISKKQTDSERTVVVDVFFDEMVFHTVSQEAGYTVNEMFAAIATILIVMTGISVLTVFEFLEFIIDACRRLCCSNKTKTEKVINDSEMHGDVAKLNV